MNKENYEEHNLFKKLLLYHKQNCKMMQYSPIFNDLLKDDDLEKGKIKIETDKKFCDEIFAQFLNCKARNSNQEKYMKLVKFVLAYR